MYEVRYCLLLLCKQVNLLTPRAFLPKVSFLDILEIFSLGMGQISSNLLKKAFATWQRAFLSTSTATTYLLFTTYLFRHAQKSFFFIFFAFSFFYFFLSFCVRDWPSTGLASSLKISQKASLRQSIFTARKGVRGFKSAVNYMYICM